MRRRRKIWYWVQDWSGKFSHFWWYKGRWQQECGPGASSSHHPKTLRAVCRSAEQLWRAGGVPLITKYFMRKGKRCAIDYNWRKGQNP